MTIRTLAVVCAGLLSLGGQAASLRSLETLAERSRFHSTARYEEVARLCAAYASNWPKAVRCTEFGRTPEGRPMLALVISKSGVLTPEDAREHDMPVLLAQGGIHAGEIDGKDAGFLVARELLTEKAAPHALESFVLVFVPVFNVDGHERFGRWNRPNQNGPEEMGWRATAQNLNLNRDYTKADAPEMRAMLRLLGAWDPVLYTDLHVTDGAQFQPDVANIIEPFYTGDVALQTAGRALSAQLNNTIALQGSLPLDFYPSFDVSDDPASGFKARVYPPRFSHGYWPLHNRFALLVETHSWKDYARRVRVTHDILVALAGMMAHEGKVWRALTHEADRRAMQLGGQDVPLTYQNGPHVALLDFRGYAYTREPSAISGDLVTHYDPTKPQVWHVPFKDSVIPKLTVRAPLGGYLIPPAHAAWLAERLALHGVHFERLDAARREARVEAFRAASVKFATAPFENHMTAEIAGQWQAEKRDLLAGSLFVPIAQANARLVVTLLEPQSPDSYAAWGFFNSAFEQKESMEAYVAEEVAREMLDSDPAIAAAFRQQLAQDAEFAKNPGARRDFFYRRHPSWDERFNLYPIYRLAAAPR
jgi:hypothetical protein